MVNRIHGGRGRSMQRCGNIIRLDLKEIDANTRNWNHLVQGSDWRRTIVNAVLNLPLLLGSEKVGESLLRDLKI